MQANLNIADNIKIQQIDNKIKFNTFFQKLLLPALN